MNTQIVSTQTNDIRHKITFNDKNGRQFHVQIRLNDECKNGHQDFSITGSIYEAGKPCNDRHCITSGAIGDKIAKARPSLAIFNTLHLCDYKGIPMHAGANGFYHLENGFNNTKPDAPTFAAEYCDYYRITPDQFKELSKTRNVIQFSIALQNLGILDQWEIQAKEAIELLETMTGKTFVIDSKRTQFVEPTPEQIAEENKRQADGYYTHEAGQQRELNKQEGILNKLRAERDKDIEKANVEYNVKEQVLLIGGEKALNNCIFYNHSNTLAFNWKSYEMLSQELIQKITEEIKLPEGVKIEDKKGK